MYRYFLGAFGNRYYIRPFYEINGDGTITDIDDERFAMFENGGTVSVYFNYDDDSDSIKNRLLKFKLDMESDLHPNFNADNENSNKYRIEIDSNIEELEHDEIIEVIDLECPFDEFLNDKTKRKLRINHRPNQLVLLKRDGMCYGPFDCAVSGVENYYGDEAFYTISVFVNTGVVNCYKFIDIEHVVFDAGFSLRRNDKIQFVYKKNRLDKIEPNRKIDYYDNEELASFMTSLLENEDDISELTKLREHFIKFADSFSEADEVSEKKIRRIVEVLTKASQFDDYKLRITEEYFKNNPSSQADKEAYLSKHEELLIDIAKEETRYEDQKKALESQLDDLKKDLDNITEKVIEEEEKLQKQKAESEKFAEEALIQKKQELDKLNAKKVEIEAEIETKTKTVEKIKDEHERWIGYKNDVKKEYDAIVSDIDGKIIDWAKQNRTAEITKFLMYRLDTPDIDDNSSAPPMLTNVDNEMNAEQVINHLRSTMETAGRSISKDDAYNLLISVAQNYITVFAGEPGTGKTSLCKLLAKSLGLYSERFAQILVERGWTSSRDLVGYYNPLTKQLEETQPMFSKCIKQLDLENRNGIVQAPYFVLLDEANLSPIEYYWSIFNYYCDSPDEQQVSYPNGVTYRFGSELKFLATINYDQTTSDLSPRFLDRAWVVPMNSVVVENVLGNMIDDSTIPDSDIMISFECLNRLFDWKTQSDKQINQKTKTLILTIASKYKEAGHIVSPRSLKSIWHYYSVAENYMTSKEVALDYAIAQKLLPQLSGNGKKYLEFLNSLMSICKENQLVKSASIIDRIIKSSEHEFYAYFSS